MTVRPIRAALFIMILALFLPAVSVHADDGTVLTLEEIVETAVRRNPSITASQQEVAASRARVKQAASAYLPQVSAGSSYTRLNEWSTNVFTGKDYRGQYNDYQVGVNVNQYLYDFGQTDGRVEQSRYSLSASQNGVAVSVSDTVRDVKRSYFEVLKRQNLIKVNQESVRIQEEHLDQAKAFYQSGIRAKIDVTKGETEVATSRLNLIRAQFDYQAARLNMESILGGPPVAGSYTLADVRTPPSAESLSVESLIQEANTLRPEIKRIKDQIQAALAQLKSSKATHWPTIYASGAGGWENRDFPLEDYWQMGVNVSVPIFTGFNTEGKIEESRAQVDRLEAVRKQIELQVLNEVSTAYLGLNTAIEAIKTSETGLVQAKENMDLADGRYKNGVGSALEYSDAELALTQARSSLVQAYYLYHQQIAELDHAVGR